MRKHEEKGKKMQVLIDMCNFIKNLTIACNNKTKKIVNLMEKCLVLK